MKVFRVAIVILALVAAFGAIFLGGSALKAALAGLAMIAGIYIGLRHPTWLLWVLAFVAGLFPAGYLPGVHVPMVFSFAMGLLLATVVHPREVTAFTTLERWVIALVGVSFVSLVASGFNLIAIMEYVKWTAATMLIIVLLRLPRDQLKRFGQVYVFATTAASILAIGIVVGDSSGRVLRSLSILGYGTETESTRFVYTNGAQIARLAGTFLEPNAAGIGITVAVLICGVVLRGWYRFGCGIILLAALALTLSRAALFAVVAAVVLMLIFGNLTTRLRLSIVGAFVVAGCAAVAIPQIRNRIFSSFGSQDAGSSARLDALREFPSYMAGKWVFGRGWGLIEFKDPTKGNTNFVANAPLLATYRGGVIVAVVFVLTMLYASHLAYQCLRSTQWEYAFYGGGFIGFFFITMQLDIGTVTIPASTAALSLLVAFLVYTHEQAMAPDDEPDTPVPQAVGVGVPEQVH